MNQACDKVVNQCLPCNDFPIENLSAELPDAPTFLGIFTYPNQPPIGNLFIAKGCLGYVFSTISQEDADDKALQQAELCAWTDSGRTDGCNGGEGNCEPTITGFQPRGFFRSNEQVCQVPCPDPDGTPSTFRLPAGAVLSGISQADADARAAALCIKRAKGHILCFTNIFDPGCLNQAYTSTLIPTGGEAPYIFDVVAGSPPPGLVLINVTGELQGVPTLAGTFIFVVRVTDANGITHDKPFTMRIVEITTPAILPAATQGVLYTLALSEIGAVNPLSWQLIAGSLPNGLTLDETTGVISGTPVDGNVSSLFTIELQDKAT